MTITFSYGLPRGSRSSILWDLWRDFNQYLYHPALPFLVYEKRYPVDRTKTPSKPVLGNRTRLTLDDRDKKEKTITISISDSKIGEVPIEVHVFQQGVDQKEFINSKAVVFSQNGQVHGFFPRSFISQDLGFSLLRDSMLVHVDCTKIKTSFRQDLFKGSRDRLNEGLKTEYLVEKIANVLRSNDELKVINQNRKNKILRESIEDKNILQNLFSNLPIDKDIMNLLKSDSIFNFLKKNTQNKEKDIPDKDNIKKGKYVSKRFPSIFKIDISNDRNGNKIKSIPLNGKGIIKFETDVEDEYLFRPKDKGELQIIVLGFKTNDTKGGENALPSKVEDMFDITKTGPIDNAIKITFEPKENLNVGDEVKLCAKLSTPDGNLESIFWVKIVNPNKEESRKEVKRENDNVSPPRPIRVYEKAEKEDDATWKEYFWSGDDIVKVTTGKDEKDNLVIEAIAVNMDSFVLKKHLSKKEIRTEEEIKQAKNRYFLLVYLHSLFLFSILDKINKDDDSSNEIDPEDIIPTIFKPYSVFLLSTILTDLVQIKFESE